MILAGAFVLARSLRRHKLWLPLLVWSVVCVLLMLSPTLPLWNHLPELRFVQLPWRWLLCLNVPFAVLVAMGLQRWWWRIVLCVAMLAVLLTVWHRVQNPWWDNAGDIQEMLDNQQDGTGNEGADEYVPIRSRSLRCRPEGAASHASKAKDTRRSRFKSGTLSDARLIAQCDITGQTGPAAFQLSIMESGSKWPPSKSTEHA